MHSLISPFFFGTYDYDLINKCLENLLKRGVFNLELYIGVRVDNSLPCALFTCKRVVKLKLGSAFIVDTIPDDALFPALKTLTLVSLWFDDKHGCAFQKLLSTCPVLEELVIDGFNWQQWKWSGIVSSPTLKRFTAWREWEVDWIVGHDDQNQMITIDTPSLVYLNYTDVPQIDYKVVNLNSLVEAKLQLPMFYSDYYHFDLTNLIKGLKNVEILSTYFKDTIEMFYEFSEEIPVFENLKYLLVTTGVDTCWLGLQHLLEKSPNLKKLTINGSLHYNSMDAESVCDCLLEYSFLSLCPIKILKITQFRGDCAGEMLQMKHVSKNLPSLVLLEVYVQATTDDKKQQIREDLLKLPTALSNCKVLFEFS